MVKKITKKIINIKHISKTQTVKYYLLEKNENNTKIYGVEIKFFDKAKLKTKEKIDKITDSYDLAIKIIKILSDKKVTPSSFLYVIDDILDLLQK